MLRELRLWSAALAMSAKSRESGACAASRFEGRQLVRTWGGDQRRSPMARLRSHVTCSTVTGWSPRRISRRLRSALRAWMVACQLAAFNPALARSWWQRRASDADAHSSIQFDRPDALSPDQKFLSTACAWLGPRRLVTTELFLEGPSYASRSARSPSVVAAGSDPTRPTARQSSAS
jgi:hypothetical protein